MKAILIFFILVKSLFSCVSYFEATFLKDNYYNFIPRKLAKIPNNPLFEYSHIPPWAYEERMNYYKKIKKELNLKEWAKKLHTKVKLLDQILYHNKNNTIKNGDFKKYVIFLRNIYNPNFTPIKQAKLLFNESKSNFFKLRYAYNIARLYHYAKEYNKELEYIKSIKYLKNKVDSIVWEWIDSLEAGAYKHVGKRVLSAYKFAKVFATHKSDAYIGYYDFRIKSDKEWQELMKMAKNSEEKLIFHFLRGVQQGNSLLYELNSMLKIVNQSKWIDISTYITAQKAQYKYFNKSKDKDIYIGYFIKTLIDKSNKTKLDRYLLSYFNLLIYGKKPTFPSPILSYLYYIKNLKKIDETYLSKQLLTLKKQIKDKKMIENINQYTFAKLSTLYPKHSIKKLLCNIYDNRYSFSFDFIQSLTKKSLDEYFKLKNKKNKNYLEKLILNTSFNPTKDDIVLYYSIFYTQMGNFKKALKYAKKLPIPKYINEFHFQNDKREQRVSCHNPFNTNLSGDNRGKKCKKYTHQRFLKTMIKIKSKSTPMDYFLRANGWYNISTFGNSPMFAMIYRSTIGIYKNSIKIEEQKLKKAKKFYHKALKLSKNKEFKAKIIYQLLKIAMDEEILKNCKKSRDNYCYKPEFAYDSYFDKPGQIIKLIENSKEFRKYFEEFKKYEDTKYFQKRINQCATFRYYK